MSDILDNNLRFYQTFREKFDNANQSGMGIETSSEDRRESVLKSIFNDNEKINSKAHEERIRLQREISNIQTSLAEKSKELITSAKDKETIEAKLQEYIQIEESLNKKLKIMHISTRIDERAGQMLLEDNKDFSKGFDDGKEYNSVVVSIDIRKSTDLMLKARTPKKYSEFITGLSKKLSECIIENLGIFDKFTGDGILAFFPEFYSGRDAILNALKAAEKCHLIFEKHYNEHKNSFNVFIKDIGLGIGIDYGLVTLVNTSSELTVVGIPVVYACRFSGAKAGETLLNGSAFQEVNNLIPDKISVKVSQIEIKHEGVAEAYQVVVNPVAYNHITPPEWLKNIKLDDTLDDDDSKTLKQD